MVDEQARRRPPPGTVPIIVSPPGGGSPEEMEAFAEDLADRLLAQGDMQLRRKSHADAGLSPTLADFIPLPAEQLDAAVGADWALSGHHDDLSGASPVWFISGTPPEVLIGVTPGIVVATPSGVWEGVAHLRYEADQHLLRVLPHAPGLKDELRRAVFDARRSRRGTFRSCDYCGNTTSPEWIHSRDDDRTICMPCAERHLRVVH